MTEKFREKGHHAVNDEGVYMEDLIMESVLGRKLADNEVPWHANGDTLDNRNDNLYVIKFKCK